MRIGAIVQARTSSKRLPKKILKHLPYDSGVTVLEHVIRRLKRSKLIDDIIIATTYNKDDDVIIYIAEKEGVMWFRGSEEDVLNRYYCCAKKYGLDVIVRICSDCPCLDWIIVDRTVDFHIKTGADYTSNSIEKPFPIGLGVEVINYEILEEVNRMVKDESHREHVTTYIKFRSDIFKISDYKAPDEYYHTGIRLTIDTVHDYALLCYLFENLYYEDNFFTSLDAINFLKKKEWPLLINKDEFQKRVFDNLEEEVKCALNFLELYGFHNVKKLVLNVLSDKRCLISV